MPRTIFSIAGLSALALAAVSQPTGAEEIAVGNFGVSANGMPFGVARAKGFFKQEGVDVTGIITSAGGGTSLRNMLAGGVPYGEVNPGVVIAAIQQGADLKLISDNVLTVAEFVWAVKPDSPIKSIQDFKGKQDRLHQSALDEPRRSPCCCSPRPASRPNDAELVRTGGFGEGVAALETGLIDVAPMPSRCGRSSSRNTAPSRGERHPAAARQCRRRDDGEHGGAARRLHPRRHPRAAAAPSSS